MSDVDGYLSAQIDSALSDIYILRMLMAKILASEARKASTATVSPTDILDEQARELSRQLQSLQHPGIDQTIANAAIDSLHLATERVFSHARMIAMKE
jgi:hypothetical protein